MFFILIVCPLQEALGSAELAAAKKLSENEARVSELTDKWKDRWKETQKILEVRSFCNLLSFGSLLNDITYLDHSIFQLS